LYINASSIEIVWTDCENHNMTSGGRAHSKQFPRVSALPPNCPGWQRVAVLVGSGETRSLVAKPDSIDDCRAAVEFCREAGLSLCPRGSGRSYGDAILNDQNVLLDLSNMNRILSFDPDGGTMTVEPGVRLVDMFHECHHLGWTLPASPTDSTISVGGALGANVNGKDSWRVGNFGDQVLRLKVVTAAGDVLSIDRENNAALFMAVIGGMGLLALVVEVTLQLARVPSPYLDVDITAADNVDDLIVKLEEIKNRSDFIVVWIDSYAKKEKLGRSVIHATRWSDRQAEPNEVKADVEKSIKLLARQNKRAVSFFQVFGTFINLGFHLQQIPVRLFNNFYFASHKRGDGGKQEGDSSNREMFLENNFDKSYKVPPPNILCGPHGYTVQITIPRPVAKEAMTEMLELCQSIPCPPVTTILRLHRRDDHLISFSDDGYSLNMEFHPKKRHAKKMAVFMQKFIECGIKFGSRVHLPKDMTLTRNQFQRLYPRYKEFLEVKHRWDPETLFQSDMYHRLFEEK
jgi:decaprenylphospho-beta-D-ribofuranose 2-oxidase